MCVLAMIHEHIHITHTSAFVPNYVHIFFVFVFVVFGEEGGGGALFSFLFYNCQ